MDYALVVFHIVYDCIMVAITLQDLGAYMLLVHPLRAGQSKHNQRVEQQARKCHTYFACSDNGTAKNAGLS